MGASLTATPTATGTPTVTITATSTATVTSTVTSTVTVTSTIGIGAFQVDPKTLAGGPVTVHWNLTSPVDRLNVKVFTSSFRMLKRFPLNLKAMPDYFKAGDHDLIWDGLDDRGRHLVPGRYYLFLTIGKGKLKLSAEDQVDQP